MNNRTDGETTFEYVVHFDGDCTFEYVVHFDADCGVTVYGSYEDLGVAQEQAKRLRKERPDAKFVRIATLRVVRTIEKVEEVK